MTTTFTLPRGLVVGTIGAMLVASIAVPSAQRRGRGDNSAYGMPVATNTILQNPDAYDGKVVTVTAGVEQVVSKTVFVVDQKRAASATEVRTIGKPMLVIAPTLMDAVPSSGYLMMVGKVVKFEPAAIAAELPDYTLDMTPEMGAKYTGQPVLVATSVIDGKYIDLAKQP